MSKSCFFLEESTTENTLVWIGSQIGLNSLLALKFYTSMAFSRGILSSVSLSNVPLKELVYEGALQVYFVVPSNIL